MHALTIVPSVLTTALLCLKTALLAEVSRNGSSAVITGPIRWADPNPSEGGSLSMLNNNATAAQIVTAIYARIPCPQYDARIARVG
jgi:hypothetical protein